MKVKQKMIQNADHLALHDVLNFVAECIAEGYRVPDIRNGDTLPRRFGMGQYYIFMVKDDDEEGLTYESHQRKAPETEEPKGEPTPPPTNEEFLEALTAANSKDELLELAKERGIGVPEDKQKNPMQIRKFLKDSVELRGG